MRTDERTDRETDRRRDKHDVMLRRRLNCVELCAYFPYDLCRAADVSTVVIGNKIIVPVGDRALFT